MRTDRAGEVHTTTYQAAGIPNYTLGPGEAQPTASRLRRHGHPPASCATGDIILGGTPVPGTSTAEVAPSSRSVDRERRRHAASPAKLGERSFA